MFIKIKIILSKGQLTDGKLSFEKDIFTIAGPWNIQLFNFCNFQTTFFKNFMKRLLGFRIEFESTDMLALSIFMI